MATTLFADVLTDQRKAEILNQDYLLLAADRNATPNHQALYFAGDFAGSGAGASASSVLKVPILGLDGYDLPVTVAEGVSAVPLQITDQKFTISVARGVKAYQPSDEVRFTDSLGVYNTSRFAQDMMISHSLRLTNSIAQLVGGFTNNTTTSGVALAVSAFMANMIVLETGCMRSIAPGEAMCLLHTIQAGHLRSSFATATAGAIQWNVKPELLAIRGNGYIGEIFGIDVYASSYVPTANAGVNRAGGMFVRGGIAWAHMTPSADMADQVVLGGAADGGIAVPILFERDRTALGGLTSYVSASWIGATRGYDTSPHLLGSSLITSAT